MTIEFSVGSRHYLFAESTLEACDSRLFDNDWLALQANSVSHSAAGRGTTYSFTSRDNRFVLRRYLRGGLVRHLSQEHYCWTGLRHTRPWREFELLAHMNRLGLPCPQPYACSVQHSGLFYRGQIIMYEIPACQTLAEHLMHSAPVHNLWQSVAATIRRFHDYHVYHADLNANNILIDQDSRVWLIDFDRSAIQPSKNATRWKSGNLDRLHRSLSKLAAASGNFVFLENDWRVFLSAYHKS